eukprot:CAMPEP_0194751196 /NCGR_PEP_ID=MMETSP0323_2-20130528/5297_1 /TAXON_ID=2866 ORGANISM="Crypthecodinium cohnii, Strain Seligo" /NCGR_SAMPLE_ID=MMETSP0323_2 /ASSEMBLY_ACC=CAM_ASM_000346 /LENGTH=43 /DNA_ID= /DNA_START= /DNA_END= /DNA_ORIENTATION=
MSADLALKDEKPSFAAGTFKIFQWSSPSSSGNKRKINEDYSTN